MAYEIEVKNEPITIRQNADFLKTYKFVDENDANVPLTGCKFKGQIKLHKTVSGEALYTFDSEANDGSCTVDLVNSEVTYFIPKATCQTFNFKEGAWDSIITWANDISDIFLEGKVTVKQGVTT